MVLVAIIEYAIKSRIYSAYEDILFKKYFLNASSFAVLF